MRLATTPVVAVAVLGQLVAPLRAAANPDFSPKTYRVDKSSAETCSSAKRRSVLDGLTALGLSEVGTESEADLVVELRCETGVEYQSVGPEKVPVRSKFSLSLRLSGRYGGQAGSAGSTEKQALDRARQFLSDHDTGCSITANPAQEFQLVVAPENGVGSPFEATLSTPYTLRGLKLGQAFTVRYAGGELRGCGVNGERVLAPKPEISVAGAGGAIDSTPVEREKLPVKALALTASACALALLLLAWMFLRRLKLPTFISYRRDSAGGHAARLFEELKRVFDASLLFMDSSSIGLGADFEKALTAAIAKSTVVLVIIGKTWLKELNARLEQTDYVRIEVVTALERANCVVIPLLIDDARLPSSSELPPDLADLSKRQAYSLRTDERWTSDVKALIKRLKLVASRR